MRTRLLVAFVCAALAALAVGFVAQAQTAQVLQGQAFDLIGSHAGVNTTTYALAITGPATYTATLPVSALVGNTITFVVPGLAVAGQYQAIITATGPGGSTPSVPFGFTVNAAPPTAVTNLQLIPR